MKSDLKRKNLKYFLATALALGSLAMSVSAQTPNLDLPFTQTQVRQLISTIDTQHNGEVLRVGYFLGRRQPAFPVSQGLAVLAQQIKREPVGSKRWVLMKWNQAFGLLRQNSQSRDAALEAYYDIFSLSLNKKPEKNAVLHRRVLVDFLSIVTSAFVQTDSDNHDPTLPDAALQAAAKLYFRLGSPERKTRLDWLNTVWRVSTESKEWYALVRNAEKNSGVPKNYNFYFSASQMVRSVNTARDEEATRQALSLLEKGAKLLSSSDPRHGEVKREREVLESWLRPPVEDKAALNSDAPAPPSPAPAP